MKKWCKKLLLAATAATLLGATTPFALNALFPFPLQRVRDRLTTNSVMLRTTDGTLLSWRVDRDENRRLAVPISAISPRLVEATIAVEDKRFRSHWGVDPIAVARAVFQNAAAGRRVSGASTITMQTIRLLWPRPRRIRYKIIEAFRAWQLERLAEKDEILEIYLNLAPYGGNVIGAEAAARHYFGKSANQLNLTEACLLAGIPQSPARLNPLQHPSAARNRRDFVIRRLLEDGRIDGEQAAKARRQPLGLAPRQKRLDAPHFSRLAMTKLSSGLDKRTAVDTTLIPDFQAIVSRLAERKAAELTEKNVSGPAVVVLSLADSSVLAYVGNASLPGSPARMIDAAAIGRQPGSLMKPFIFALLAGKGKMAPSTRVYDLPEAWRDYSPRNMDRMWLGAMSAGEALRRSRNITAVKQLETLGVETLAEFMNAIGLEPGLPGAYGLSLALGTKEQSLLGMTNAYAALGRFGLWKPVRLFPERPAGEERRVLSPEAAWLALAALSPPDTVEKPALVWKTGTSWNQLDAWAIAMTPELVVGVWCGRLGRGGSQWTAGGEDALPVALDIIDALPVDRASSWPMPKGVAIRLVCADSGALPGWNCSETLMSPMLASSRIACRGQHGGSEQRPAEAKDRDSAVAQSRLRIISPAPGTTYVVMPGLADSLPLLAENAPGGELTWFADGRRLGVVASGVALEWRLQPGDHRFSVTDERGQTAAATLRVVAGGDG